MASIHVVIVSTSALTRAGLQQIINQSGSGIRAVGQFETFTDAELFLADNKVRVMIVDDSHSSTNLSKIIKRLMELHPGLVFIFIMQSPTASLADKLLHIGVRALLHKDDDLENTLNRTIAASVAGNTTTSPRIPLSLTKPKPLPAKITQRDLDILQLLTEGLQTKEIATRLGVKYGVVNRALNKLQSVYEAQSVPQLILMAQQILSVRKKFE